MAEEKLGKSLDSIIEENRKKVAPRPRKSSDSSRPKGMRIDGGSKVRLSAKKAPGGQREPPRRGGSGVNTGLGVKAAGVRKKSSRPAYSYDAMEEDDDYGMGGGYGRGGRAGRRGGRVGGRYEGAGDEYGMGGGAPRRRIREAPVPRGDPDGQWSHDLYDDSDRRPARRMPGGALAGRLGNGAAAAAANNSTLLVTNLHYSVSERDINELFETCGKVVKAKLHYDASGRSEEKATVVYASREDALRAIKEYNGVELDKQALKIEFAEPEEVEPARGGGRAGIMGRLGGRGERPSGGAGTGMGFQRAMRDAVPRPAGGASRIPGRMGDSGPPRGRGRLTSGVIRASRTKEDLDAEMDHMMQE